MSMLDNADTTIEDVPVVRSNSSYLTEDEAANAFKKRWADARKEPSKKPTADEGEVTSADDVTVSEDEDLNEGAEGQDEEAPEDHDDTSVEEEKPAKKARDASDEDMVSFKVGDKEHRVSVKELKRLGGQEAALTRKSQEVSAKLAEVDAVLERQVSKAEARLKVYQDIDYTILARNPKVSDEEIAALKKEHSEAEADLKFLRDERGQLMTKKQEARAAQKVAESQEAYKQLTNPESPMHIPEWGGETYNKLHAFAKGMNIPDATFFDITSAQEMKLLWMAQQFSEAKTKVPARLNPVVKTSPKKPMKPSSGSDDSVASGVDSARKRLLSTGDVDDAAAMFRARWAAKRRS